MIAAFVVDAVEVGIWDKNYYNGANGQANCPGVPVAWFMYYWNGSIWEYHGFCHVNRASTQNQGSGICLFKYPMGGRNAANILMRRWNEKADCTGYNWNSYTDFRPDAATIADSPGYVTTRTTSMSTNTWKVVTDRRSGAIYEFYNKRGQDPNLPAGVHESAIHADMGAALQNAFATYLPYRLTTGPCGGSQQGYWNPNQAGAFCPSGASSMDFRVPPSGDGAWNVPLWCDSVRNDSCASANTSILHGFFGMYNWDYGTLPGNMGDFPNGYPGPRNPKDTFQLQQTIKKYNDYMEVNVAYRNTGDAPDAGAAEVPTMYFTNKFTTYYYPYSAGTIAPCVPVNPAAESAQLIDSDTVCRRSFYVTGDELTNYKHVESSNRVGETGFVANLVSPRWFTFENTGISPAPNYYITVGVMYGSAMMQARHVPTSTECGGSGCTGWNWSVEETDGGYHATKWASGAWQNFPQSGPVDKTYRFSYVVFPYKYNETLPGTNTTVAQKIAQLAQFYAPDNGCGMEPPIGWLDSVTAPGSANGWTLDPDTTASITYKIVIDTSAYTSLTANVLRSDINSVLGYAGNHGFSWSIPAQWKNGVSHTLRAYAWDCNTASYKELQGSPKTFCLTSAGSPC